MTAPFPQIVSSRSVAWSTLSLIPSRLLLVIRDVSLLTRANFVRALPDVVFIQVCCFPLPLASISSSHWTAVRPARLVQVTHDVSQLTCADFLRAPGVQTPVIVRFSTVVHERGSPETLRDPRGFAVKFYTREGNFDMVGNNFPVSRGSQVACCPG